MPTDRQLEANRLNARMSTGPRTTTGKARVAANALKHGLTGQDIVLPNENPHDYEAFRAGLIESLDPRGDLEGLLADRVAADAWRIRPVPILEAALHRRARYDLAIDRTQAAVRQSRSAETSAIVAKMTGMRTQQSEARQQAERKLQRAQTRKQNLFVRDPLLDATRVLETSMQAFANLWRHERALTLSMHKTLHELQRLQAVRAGEHVPAPAVLDVNLDATPPPAPNLQGDLQDDHQPDVEGDLQVISKATSTSIATDHRQPAGDRKNVFLQNKPNLPLFVGLSWLLGLRFFPEMRFNA
jgi:hypothetical protein